MNIDSFDYYLLEYIFSFSDSYELYILFETCKYFRKLFNYSSLLRKQPKPEFYLRNKKNLSWAESHMDFKLVENVFKLALRYGDMEVVKYIYKTIKPRLDERGYYSETIYNEDYLMFHWLYKKGFYLDENAFNAAAEIGDIKLLKFLEKNDCEYSENALVFAVKGGDMDCVKYLVNKGFFWDSTLYYLACDNIEILKYLISLSFNDLSRPWINSSVFKRAIEIGNVKVCKLLKKHNCPYDLTSSYLAFEKGNITVLNWLIKNNYPVDQTIINKIINY